MHDIELSVIVPLAPGEPEAEGLLAQLAGLTGRCEIIAVKAAEEPLKRPRRWPRTLPLREYVNSGGRARQLNLGARVAHGEWLWFLHADSRLLDATLPALHHFLNDRPDTLGWFDLRFRSDGPRAARLNALGANLRSRWAGMPFGDQGFVLRRERFAALGGFDETLACGEDHRFVWTARRKGLRLQRIGAPLATSARKYAEQGWTRVTLRHLRLTFAQLRAARRPPDRPG